MHENANSTPQTPPQPEFLDAQELAAKWKLPESWVRDQTRTRALDPIPSVGFGRYCRFEYGSPELNAWLDRHRRGAGSRSAPKKVRTAKTKAQTEAA
jgi:hypothetical protein